MKLEIKEAEGPRGDALVKPDASTELSGSRTRDPVIVAWAVLKSIKCFVCLFMSIIDLFFLLIRKLR